MARLNIFFLTFFFFFGINLEVLAQDEELFEISGQIVDGSYSEDINDFNQNTKIGEGNVDNEGDILSFPLELSFTFGSQFRYLRLTEFELLYREGETVKILLISNCNQRSINWFKDALRFALENTLFYRQVQADEEEVFLTINQERLISRYNSKAGNYLRRLSEHIDRLHNDSKVTCFAKEEMKMYAKPYSRIHTWIDREEEIRFGDPYHWYEYRFDSRENYIPLWFDPDHNGGDYPTRLNR